LVSFLKKFPSRPIPRHAARLEPYGRAQDRAGDEAERGCAGGGEDFAARSGDYAGKNIV